MDYYTLDRIEKEDNFPNCWGYVGDKLFEVFYISADDTESELEEQGFVYCQATNWSETMVTEKSNFN
jgi:hypothetical protein